jgi:hypothetical protein
MGLLVYYLLVEISFVDRLHDAFYVVHLSFIYSFVHIALEHVASFVLWHLWFTATTGFNNT